MAMNLFGKKKRSRRVKRAVRKPPARLLKLCKRYGVKTTRKVGRRRVYKPVKYLKKACLKRARSLVKKLKKLKKRAASFGRRRKMSHRLKSMRRRRSRSTRYVAFGNVMGSPFEQPANGGYNQPVKVTQQTLSQTSSVVNNKTNSSRPGALQLPAGPGDLYGVTREFFGQQVPTQTPPEWNYMIQPDGSYYPVGAPFYGYKTPFASAFGKKPRRRYNVKGSACNHLNRRICSANPNCTYTMRGCRRRSGTVKGGLVFEGPSLQFGKKRVRRYLP
jgi:hypothetical protein